MEVKAAGNGGGTSFGYYYLSLSCPVSYFALVKLIGYKTLEYWYFRRIMDF